MKTLVDISPPQIEALDALARAGKRSRASLIRAAIEQYLAAHHQKGDSSAFGLWSEQGEDGLDYQNRVRSEW